MVNYQLGKIYKIVGNGKIYVGSTCERLLCRRLIGHNASYKQYQIGIGGNMSSFQCLSDPEHYIELLELYPCNSKDELHTCERKWIELLDCVNQRKPCRTETDCKEYYKEYYKEYKEYNKEKIKAYMKEYQRLYYLNKKPNK
jgi:hypothetical protein